MRWNPFACRHDGPDVCSTETPDPTVDPPRHADGEDVTSPPRPIAEIQRIGPTAVATLTVTELSQEDGAEQLAELLQNMAETGATHYVLDVQNVQHMDTTCLGCLVQALNDLTVHGGRIALVNPRHSVHYIFRLTRLDRVFRICNDVPAALDAVERAA